MRASRLWMGLGVQAVGLCAVLGVGAAVAEGRAQGGVSAPSLGGAGVEGASVGLEALRAMSPRMRVSMQPDGRSVKLLSGLDVETQGGDWEARAQAFLGAWGAALGLGQGVFEPVKVSHMKGLHAVQLQQVHEGLPVYQRFVVVTLSDDGRARSLSSDAALVGVLARGDVGEGEARAAAQRVVYGDALPQGVDAPMSARLVVVADAASAVVAWHVQVAALPVLTPVDVLVDSRDGRVLLARDGVMR